MTNDITCVFCKIVLGEEPSSKIYEDADCLAFMGIHPVNDGECIIIPKKHIDHFSDVPDELVAHLMIKARLIANKIRETFHPKRVGYVVTGFGVPHAHLLIVPLHKTYEITSSAFAYIEEGQVKFSEQQVPLADRTKLDELAAKLTIKT